MSSWKVETRAHQERSQPKARKKFGLLEKAQDYKKRAAAHHRKEKRIQSMKLKAEFKNPDEFYFGMVNAQTKNGVHKLSADTGQLAKDTIMLLKTQDIGYVKSKAQSEQRKIERLRAQLHQIHNKDAPAAAGGYDSDEAPPQQSTKHLVFVEGDEDVAAFKPTKYFDTTKDQLEQTHNRQRKRAVAAAAEAAADDAAELASLSRKQAIAVARAERKSKKRAERELSGKYKELEERQERLLKLRRTAEHFESQRNLLTKGRRVKVADAAGGLPAKFKWTQKRSK